MAFSMARLIMVLSAWCTLASTTPWSDGYAPRRDEPDKKKSPKELTALAHHDLGNDVVRVVLLAADDDGDLDRRHARLG